MTTPHKARVRSWLHPFGACLLALTLAACGGGGGGDVANGGGGGSIAPSSLAAQRCSPNNPFAAVNLRTGSLGIEKQWVRSYLNEAYLWYDEVPTTVNPNETPFSTEADVYGSLNNYFGALLTPDVMPSGRYKDRFSFTSPTEAWNALSQSGVTAGYGIEVVAFPTATNRNIRVVYIEPGSEAESKLLQRGDQLYAVDGVSADDSTDAGFALLIAALFPSAADITNHVTHNFQFTRGGLFLQPMTMTAANVTKRPVLVTNTINYNNGEKVGYLLFNDHIATAEQQLVDAVRFFQNQAISDLVIDLRYNGGGALYIASELAYMVAGPARTSNKVFEQLSFNAKRTADTNHPDARFPFFETRFDDGTPLPNLNLSRVYVLASGNTCSASESIINSLRGVGVDVRLIGGATCGKPYGFSAKDNCGISYFPIEFQGVNALGFGDYANGFAPSFTNAGANVAGCSAADDLTHALGDPAETMLAMALGYRLNNNLSCPILGGRSSPLSARAAASGSGSMLRSPARENRVLVTRH